jgi:enamine deaminase RidA (YjgF/YER057c/UK114 family)
MNSNSLKNDMVITLSIVMSIEKNQEAKRMKKKTYPLFYAGKKQRFARSVVVGDLIFVSGSSGRTMETGEVSSDNVKDQVIVALDKIRGALEEAGSSMNNIVKTVIYLKDMNRNFPFQFATKRLSSVIALDHDNIPLPRGCPSDSSVPSPSTPVPHRVPGTPAGLHPR